MVLKLFKDKTALAAAAAEQAGTSIRHAIAEHGKARIIAATGASQFEFLEALTSLPGIDWKQVEMFHLDEYIGLPASHPASFSNYLQQRLIQKTGITQHYLLDGDGDPAGVIGRTSQALRQASVDVAFVGVGENGHLAFNDPPADFETEEFQEGPMGATIREQKVCFVLQFHLSQLLLYNLGGHGWDKSSIDRRTSPGVSNWEQSSVPK